MSNAGFVGNEEGRLRYRKMLLMPGERSFARNREQAGIHSGTSNKTP